MKIVFFSHPDFFNSRSMNIYLNMLSDGMRQRGHDVQVWKPQPVLYRLPLPRIFKKWMGYIDQFILFPASVNRKLQKTPVDTLFVFTDNALGPWVPLVCDKPHVMHCHDFLAQQSETGEIRENILSWTGRKYQNYIRNGYRKGKHFICVSQKTKEDLLQILNTRPETAEVVYNGINPVFKPSDKEVARTLLSSRFGINLRSGYLLHVGGNLWYKNRVGVLECYLEWRASDEGRDLPLLLVGEDLNTAMKNMLTDSIFKKDIHVLSGLGDEILCNLYAGASIFLFPSLYEGFGWPIAEAMACGCPVITTDAPPMNEVGGKAAFYLSKRPSAENEVGEWKAAGARKISGILNMKGPELSSSSEAGLAHVKKFDLNDNLDKIESIYEKVLSLSIG